jgi:hypothetical protein
MHIRLIGALVALALSVCIAPNVSAASIDERPSFVFQRLSKRESIGMLNGTKVNHEASATGTPSGSDDNLVARMILIHGGNSTITLAPQQVSLLFGQLRLACPGRDIAADSLFEQFKTRFAENPMPIQSALWDRGHLNRNINHANLPPLAFKAIIPVRQFRFFIEVSKPSISEFSASNLVEPLILVVELHCNWHLHDIVHLSAVFNQLDMWGRPKYILRDVDYASLLIGFVHDFNEWKKADMAPEKNSKILSKVMFRQSEEGEVHFFWDMHGFQFVSEECDRYYYGWYEHNNNCYFREYESFNTLLRDLNKHLGQAGGRIINRYLVHDLFAAYTDLVCWQARHYDMYIWLVNMVQTNLVARILSWPQSVGAPFLIAIGKLMKPHIMSHPFGSNVIAMSSPCYSNLTATQNVRLDLEEEGRDLACRGLDAAIQTVSRCPS